MSVWLCMCFMFIHLGALTWMHNVCVCVCLSTSSSVTDILISSIFVILCRIISWISCSDILSWTYTHTNTQTHTLNRIIYEFMFLPQSWACNGTFCILMKPNFFQAGFPKLHKILRAYLWLWFAHLLFSLCFPTSLLSLNPIILLAESAGTHVALVSNIVV